MKRENFKEYLFTFGTFTFLFLFFYSFIDIKWSNETLDNLKTYIGSLGLLVVSQYIHRSKKVLTRKSYNWIIVLSVIFSITLYIWVTFE